MANPAAPNPWYFLVLNKIRDGIWSSIKQHPEWWIPALFAIVRSFGVTVVSGEKGVRFFCGRVSGELDPGFHWLVPGLHSVKKRHVRSSTADLAAQLICLPDGLVYRVDVNVVYRIDDATAAVVNVDHLEGAVFNMLPVAVQTTLWERRRADLEDQEDLDAHLMHAIQSRVARWGVTVEHAGFMTIAPTTETMRVTQLGARVEERRVQYHRLRANGLGREQALGVLGARRRLVAKDVEGRRRSLRRPGKPSIPTTNRGAISLEKLIAEVKRKLAVQGTP